jgi:hemerythrin
MQTAASQTFRWSEVYSVHIAILDEQHRRLVATTNKLNQALRSGWELPSWIQRWAS